MVRFLISTILFIMANAVGLIAAAVLLPDFKLNIVGFTASLLFFTAAGIILGPLILKMSIKYAPALRGGIALVTTFTGLLLTSVFTDGLNISGLVTWVIAPLIVWVFVVLAGILLPLVLFKKTLGHTNAYHSSVNNS